MLLCSTMTRRLGALFYMVQHKLAEKHTGHTKLTT